MTRGIRNDNRGTEAPRRRPRRTSPGAGPVRRPRSAMPPRAGRRVDERGERRDAEREPDLADGRVRAARDARLVGIDVGQDDVRQLRAREPDAEAEDASCPAAARGTTRAGEIASATEQQPDRLEREPGAHDARDAEPPRSGARRSGAAIAMRTPCGSIHSPACSAVKCSPFCSRTGRMNSSPNWPIASTIVVSRP